MKFMMTGAITLATLDGANIEIKDEVGDENVVIFGMDKDEVIAISRKIETFDISIQPYEDCCTVFTPKHPRTHPTIAGVEKAERGTEWDEPIKRAVEGTKVTVIKAFSKGE